MKTTSSKVYKLVISGLLLAIGIVLPIIFHSYSISGSIFLPMHFPVLLCGLLCGMQYGLITGAAIPFAAFLITSRPPIYPHAISMAFELAAYGFVAAFSLKIYSKFMKKELANLIALITAMLAGRVVMAAANLILLGISGSGYTFEAFLSGAFITALPGIIIQIIFIPAIMLVLDKSGFTSRLYK